MDKEMTIRNARIEILEEKPVYSSDYGTLFDDRVRFSSGAEGTYLRFVWTNSASVAVLPLDKQGFVYLVSPFRHAARRVVTEVPKGFVEPGYRPEDAAIRELREETGLRGGALVSLGSSLADPAFSSTTMHLFAALDCERVGGALLEETESHSSVVRLPFVQLLARCLAGEVEDAITELLVLKCEALKLLKKDSSTKEGATSDQ